MTKFSCKLLCVLLLMGTISFASAQISASRQQEKTSSQNISPRGVWRAGVILSEKCVAASPIEDWFQEEEISDHVFQRMWKKSYKEGARISRSELRYLKVIHRNFEGQIQTGEIVCNRLIAHDLLEIFKVLFQQSYPIEKILLVDNFQASDALSMRNNNTSAFNYREIRNTGKLSNHSFGMAIDLNPLYNPCVIRRKDGTLSVEPIEGQPYSDRNRQFPHKITSESIVYKEFKKRGFIWGGDWKSLKDYQHFEKKVQE